MQVFTKTYEYYAQVVKQLFGLQFLFPAIHWEKRLVLHWWRLCVAIYFYYLQQSNLFLTKFQVHLITCYKKKLMAKYKIYYLKAHVDLQFFFHEDLRKLKNNLFDFKWTESVIWTSKHQQRYHPSDNLYINLTR